MIAWYGAFSQRRARDVVFDARDPLPFLLQPLVLWYNWKESQASLFWSSRRMKLNGMARLLIQSIPMR